MSERDQWIERLAGDILDGASIDWAFEGSGVHAAERPLLEHLQLLARVAELNRRPRPGPPPRHPARVEDPMSAEGGPAIVDDTYRIEGLVGRGGMGFVYRARHIALGKVFAIKLVQPHRSHRPDYLERFRIEAQALGRLNHTNIVQVTDFGVDPRVGPYLVMEYIDGLPLSEYLTHRGALPLDEALPIFDGIARALDYAHDSGILHRDLKPGNVLLVRREGGHHDAKLVDFGIASFLGGSSLDSSGTPEPVSESAATVERPLQSVADVADEGSARGAPASGPARRGLTAPGTIVGTLDYIAPEILTGGAASSSADIYAFGVLIYEALVGRRPFGATTPESPKPGVPPRPSSASASIPKDLDRAILKALDSDPHARPDRVRDVVAELDDACHHAQVRYWRRSEFPRRAALSMGITMLVLLLQPFVQGLTLSRTMENALRDFRVSLHPLRPPDPRIVLMSIDDATVQSDSRSLPDRADDVGTLLGRVFDAGARAVAVDLLFPESWSRSEAFSQLVLDHAPNLVLASYSGPDGDVSGPESVRGLPTVVLGREKIEALFGFVNVSPDIDGVVRTMALSYRDRRGTPAYSFAARVAGIATSGRPLVDSPAARVWIDYSLDWTRFERISWKDAASVLADRPEAFRGRVVMVGAEFSGSGDLHSTVARHPALPGEASGLVLQALTLNTLLDGREIRTPDQRLVAGLLGLAIVAAVMAILSGPNPHWTIAGLAVAGVLYLACALLRFRWNDELWPIVGPASAFGLAMMSAAVLRYLLPAFPQMKAEKA